MAVRLRRGFHRSGARERRAVDAYIFCELLTEAGSNLVYPLAEAGTLQRIGVFVDLAQNSSQDDLSFQQAGGSRVPPLNASTA